MDRRGLEGCRSYSHGADESMYTPAFKPSKRTAHTCTSPSLPLAAPVPYGMSTA